MRSMIWRCVAPSLLASVLSLQGCASLPPLEARTASTRLEPVADSALGRSIMP